MKNFTIHVEKWRELKFRGNCKCPKCKGMLVVVPVYAPNAAGNVMFAYCMKCKKVFEAKDDI